MVVVPAREALLFPESESQKIDPFLPTSMSRDRCIQSSQKPFVTLTFATSLDSQLAIAPGVQTALSGPQSKAMTHYLRSRHDAILVGVGTAIADDPSLNCRIEGVGGYGGKGLVGQPRPVVIDPNGRWRFTSESKVMKLARNGRGKGPFILTCVEPSAEQVEVLEGVGGKFIISPSFKEDQQCMTWNHILELLAKEKIESVMIEGGGGVINSLLGDGAGYELIDSIIVTIAPTWLGQGGVQVCPRGSASNTYLPTTRLKDVQWIPLGEDVVLCGHPNIALRS